MSSSPLTARKRGSQTKRGDRNTHGDPPPLLLEEENDNEDSSSNSGERFFEVGGRNSEGTAEADPLEPPSTISQMPEKKSLLDKFLSYYVQFFSNNASNQDRGLKVLQWSLWLISTKFSDKTKRQSLYKFYLDISFVRYALRLYGFPEALQAAKTNAYGKSWLEKFMAWSMVIFYPLENIAYFQWKAPGVFPHHKRSLSANKFSAYSCRVWLAYLVAEVARSLMKLRDMKNQKRQLEGDNYGKNYEAVRQVKESIRNERLQMIRSLLFTLPCVTWSLPKWDTDPLLREGIVNSLMWLESIVAMFQSLCTFQPK